MTDRYVIKQHARDRVLVLDTITGTEAERRSYASAERLVRALRVSTARDGAENQAAALNRKAA